MIARAHSRFFTVDTSNGKIVGKPRRGFAAALQLPIAQTCPDSCSLKASGECYAKNGRMAIHTARLERENEGRDAIDIAREAALQIATAANTGLASGRPLRLFTAGDARTPAIAKIIATAARVWLAAGGRAWGYTHAWRDVPASTWRGVSMLASVESVDDARKAIARGYVPARIVASHAPDGRAYVEAGIKWIPCPEQTRGVPCVACGLCFDTEALAARGAGIDFAVHGNKANALKRRLPMLQASPAVVLVSGMREAS